MLLNAENLPIEHIDRIQITLNPALSPYINYEKRNIDPKKHLRLSYNYKYGIHWYLDIQAQNIDPRNIYASIAGNIFQLIEKDVIVLPVKKEIMALFIYRHLEYFIQSVKELELSFDFEPDALEIINPKAFIHCKTTLYSIDRRRYKGRPSRKSFLKTYNRNDRLKKVNQLAYNKIERNPFSQRIEFTLTNNNSPYRSLNNLKGTYQEVISRYIPYLAVRYYKYFYKNMQVDTKDHPYFSQLYELAAEGRTRYTGNHLEETTTHKPSEHELKFYSLMIKKTRVSTESTNNLALQALQI